MSRGEAIRNATEPVVKTFLRNRGVMPLFRKFTRAKDQATTAPALQGFLADRPLYLPKATTWANEFLSEMLTFPAAGKGHDDQCDALLTLAMGLQKVMAKAVVEKPEARQPLLGPGQIWL